MQLQQLVWSPIEEMAQLHTGGTPLASVVSIHLESGRPHPVLPAAAAAAAAGGGAGAGGGVGAGTVADINVSFALLPAMSAGTLAIEVLGGALTAFVEFAPPPRSSNTSGAYSVRVGVGPGSHVPSPPAPPPPQPASNATANLTRMMPNTDMGGADYSITHHPPSFRAADCQALCDGHAKCKAWVWAARGQPAGSGDCCLKEAVPCPVHKPPLPSETVTSGAKVSGLQRCCECTRQHCDCPHGSGGSSGGEWPLRRG